MRSLPSGLATALPATTTSLARLCTITRRDGLVVRFTTAADTIVHNSAEYPAAVAVSLSAIRSRSDFGSTSCTLEVASSDNGIFDYGDLTAGFFDAADVVIDAVDALTPENGTMRLFDGRFATVSLSDAGKATVEMRGRLYRDRSLAVQKYTPHCRTDLGTPTRCKVDLSTYTQAGSVTAIVSEYEITVSLTGASRADGWFNWGTLQWVTGKNAGLMVEVRGWVQATNRLTLMMPTYGVIEEGDTFFVTAGCDKRLSTCSTKFGNQLNFRGEPHVPVIAGQATEYDPGSDIGDGTGGGWSTPRDTWPFRVTMTGSQQAYPFYVIYVSEALSNPVKIGNDVEGYFVTYNYTGPNLKPVLECVFYVTKVRRPFKTPKVGFIVPRSGYFSGISWDYLEGWLTEISGQTITDSYLHRQYNFLSNKKEILDTGYRVNLKEGFYYSFYMRLFDHPTPSVGSAPAITLNNIGWALSWDD